MCKEANSMDMSNVTSSQASADGLLPFESPDGPTIDPAGQDHAHASRSASPGNARRSKTSVTCGPIGGGSLSPKGRKSSGSSKSHRQKLSAQSLRLLSLSRFRLAITRGQTKSPINSGGARVCTTLNGGSMEYSQTWKQRITPGGLKYWAHTASTRRTSGLDCSGW